MKQALYEEDSYLTIPYTFTRIRQELPKKGRCQMESCCRWNYQIYEKREYLILKDRSFLLRFIRIKEKQKFFRDSLIWWKREEIFFNLIYSVVCYPPNVKNLKANIFTSSFWIWTIWGQTKNTLWNINNYLLSSWLMVVPYGCPKNNSKPISNYIRNQQKASCLFWSWKIFHHY